MLSCAVGFTLLFASLWMSFIKRDTTIFQKFQETLDESQTIIYAGIVRERLSIYVMGMILGLALGFTYYLKHPTDNFRLCKLLAIIYSVKLMFYYVYPKRPLMLYSLKTQEQVEAWADIYTEMKRRWVTSLGVGFVGYLVLSQSC